MFKSTRPSRPRRVAVQPIKFIIWRFLSVWQNRMRLFPLMTWYASWYAISRTICISATFSRHAPVVSEDIIGYLSLALEDYIRRPGGLQKHIKWQCSSAGGDWAWSSSGGEHGENVVVVVVVHHSSQKSARDSQLCWRDDVLDDRTNHNNGIILARADSRLRCEVGDSLVGGA